MPDLIGQANKRHNFEDKFAALLSNTTRSVTREIKDGSVSPPKGCIQLEKKAVEYIWEFKADRLTGGAEAYTFLGTANYVKHEGSRPMNITWKLDRPIPAKFLKKTNKLVVG